MSKELKLGIFTIVVLLATIWGYTYLKGKNLLTSAYQFTATFDDVSQLNVSSPVLLNGLQIGSVTKIKINRENLQEMTVHFLVEGEYEIPTDATVLLVSESVMGGKALSLKYDKVCSGNCAQNGHHFKSKDVGLIGSMLGNEDVNSYIKSFSTEVNEVLESIGDDNGKGAVHRTIREMEEAVDNLNNLVKVTSGLVAKSQKSLIATLDNVNVITNNLAANNSQVTAALENVNAITSDLKKSDIGNNLNNTSKTLDATVIQLKQTLEKTDGVMTNLNQVLEKANDGDGSLSRLLNDQDLYANLEMTSQNLALLLQDLRLNPKRYLNVSVFGRKSKQYVKPENDPAFDNNQK